MSNKRTLFTLALVSFLDLLGVGLIIPIIAPLFENPNGGLLSPGTSEATRNIMYGLVVASYPIAQFFGAPILGVLSDFKGRKPLLIITRAGSVIAFLLSAIAVWKTHITLLIIARVIDGVTGGNISVANSAIADISTKENKSTNFGLIGAAFGLGFLIGPYLGGLISDSSLVPWFSNSTPFLFAALLGILNIFCLVFLFKETLKTKVKKRISFVAGFRNLKKAFTKSGIERLFLSILLYTIGFSFYTQTLQLFLAKKYSFGAQDIGELFGYVGLWIIITQGFIIRKLSKRFPPKKLLRASLPFLALAFIIHTLPHFDSYYLVITPLLAISNGLTTPSFTTLVSNFASSEIQGEILGINQSLQSIGIAIGPLIAGIIFTYWINLPIYVGAGFILLSWLVLQKFLKIKDVSDSDYITYQNN